MTKNRFGLLALLIVVGLGFAFFGSNNLRESAMPCDPIEFMSWEDLKPGQKGFGLTTFQGNEPEKFYVEFCAVRPHPLCRKEKIILVRMGKPLENSSVLFGMSGSPVYFQHEGKWKLVGALGFGYGAFSSGRSLGGITPIHAMLNQEKTLGLTLTAKNLITKKMTEVKNIEDLPKTLSEPIDLGNHDGFRIQMLQPMFQIVSDNTADGSTDSKITAPKPGEAITVLLTRGDFSIGATCTVTHVAGNKFWACGHPMHGEGKVVMPAYKAEIATAFKSASDGFLLPAKTTHYIGYISYDSAFGLEGEIQNLPENIMLPVSFSVTINDGNQTKKANFRFEVLKDKIHSNILINWGASELLENFWNPKNKATTRSISTITFTDGKSIQIFDSSAIGGVTQWGPFTILDNPWSAVSRTASVVMALMDNQWNLEIKDIRIETVLEAGAKVLVLDSYKILDKERKVVKEVKPGDKVELVLGLKTMDSSTKFVASIPLQIPKELNLEDYADLENYANLVIHVESGNYFKERNPEKLLNHQPDNKEEFLKALLTNQRPPEKLYIQLVFPKTKLKKKKSAETPKLLGEKWQKVKDLDFLRLIQGSETKVEIKELKSPLNDHLLIIARTTILRILTEDKK